MLYDYTAQMEEELSVTEGEYVVLTEVGIEAGEGWAEVNFFSPFMPAQLI